jgi:hypothetical protein
MTQGRVTNGIQETGYKEFGNSMRIAWTVNTKNTKGKGTNQGKKGDSLRAQPYKAKEMSELRDTRVLAKTGNTQISL